MSFLRDHSYSSRCEYRLAVYAEQEEPSSCFVEVFTPKMRRLLIVLAILAVFSAILIYQLHKRLYGIPIPDGFNPNSTFSFQVVGFLFNFAKDVVSLV